MKDKIRTAKPREARLWAVTTTETAERVRAWARARDVSVSTAVNLMVQHYLTSEDKS
jgi:hypothetical protein